MSENSIITAGTFEHYSVSEHGITFKADIPKKQWLEMVANLCALFEGAVLTREKALMMLADSLNAGEELFGEEFAQSISATREYLGLSPKTIANAQWTYKRIPPEKRRIGITLGHYSVVAALEEKEQEKYFDQILTHKMTIAVLKEIVAEEHPKTARATKRKTGEDTDATILGKLESCSHYFVDHNPTEGMKFQLRALNLVYRRKWQAKK